MNATVSRLEPGSNAQGAAAAIDRLAQSLPAQSWFAALGEPPTDAERRDATAYLAGLGLEDVTLSWVPDFAAAEAVTRDTDWDKAWWAAEERRVAALLATAEETLGRRRVTQILNRLMAAASEVVIGPAAVAAARAGVADQALIRVAAGAASQACYQAASVLAASADHAAHPFGAKFRLFAGGHWPLACVGGAFHIF